MSESVRPHRRQPTRLPCHWDFPGKNTGVGCHFLLQCMKVKTESEVTQSCLTLSDPMDCSPPGSSIHGIFQARVLEWGATAFSATPSTMVLNLVLCLLFVIFVNYACSILVIHQNSESSLIYMSFLLQTINQILVFNFLNNFYIN